jgi:hypothetical protein
MRKYNFKFWEWLCVIGLCDHRWTCCTVHTQADEAHLKSVIKEAEDLKKEQFKRSQRWERGFWSRRHPCFYVALQRETVAPQASGWSQDENMCDTWVPTLWPQPYVTHTVLCQYGVWLYGTVWFYSVDSNYTISDHIYDKIWCGVRYGAKGWKLLLLHQKVNIHTK